jgi:hypothetical protein
MPATLGAAEHLSAAAVKRQEFSATRPALREADASERHFIAFCGASVEFGMG